MLNRLSHPAAPHPIFFKQQTYARDWTTDSTLTKIEVALGLTVGCELDWETRESFLEEAVLETEA